MEFGITTMAVGEIISAANLFLSWRKRKADSFSHYSEFVMELADEVDELAEIWTALLTELLNNRKVNFEDHPILDSYTYLPENWRHRNIRQYSRLQSFYSRLHAVLGELDIDTADLLLEKVAQIMETRNLTREKFSDFTKENWSESQILLSIEALNKQAAEIRVFALEMKSQEGKVG